MCADECGGNEPGEQDPQEEHQSADPEAEPHSRTSPAGAWRHSGPRKAEPGTGRAARTGQQPDLE